MPHHKVNHPYCAAQFTVLRPVSGASIWQVYNGAATVYNLLSVMIAKNRDSSNLIYPLFEVRNEISWERPLIFKTSNLFADNGRRAGADIS